MKERVEAQNVPVSFYGMVIDQNSNGLAGVRVKLGVRHNVYGMPNSAKVAKYAASSDDELQKVLNPTIELQSDSDGRFQWTDTDVSGDSLGVENLEKTGYESEFKQYRCGVKSGSYEKPIIFKMWSANIHQQLITGQKEFAIIPDGRLYVISLTKGAITESGVGDFTVRIRYTNQIVVDQLYDWFAEIAVNNGGLLEQEQGSPMYSAPEDGYSKAFHVQQQIKGGQCGEIGDRDFYLRLKDGQEYGRMKINLYAPYGKLTPGLVRVSYAINPSGSRILR